MINSKSAGTLINIYLNPEVESAASDREVADYIGISLPTFRDRKKTLGIDHYLTYYPGRIPSHLKRYKGRSGQDSKLGSIGKCQATEIAPCFARALVIGLIRTSQKHFISSRCEESKRFLLNENKMLEWYMEAYPGIDQRAFIERMKRWVDDHA